MGAEGITCNNIDQVGDAFEQSLRNQEEGKTTVTDIVNVYCDYSARLVGRSSS